MLYSGLIVFLQNGSGLSSGDSLSLYIIVSLFLVMVVGLFSWIIKELSNLNTRLIQNQNKIMDKLEDSNKQVSERKNDIDVLFVKIDHLTNQLPDYQLVFRKFTELDERVNNVSKESKRNQLEINRINQGSFQDSGDSFK